MVQIIDDQVKFDELRNSGKPFVLHVGAEWCAPSKTVNALLDQSPANVLKVYVDAEKLPAVAEACDVDAVPSVLFFRSDTLTANAGKTSIVAAVSGAKLDAIAFHLNSLFGARPKTDFKSLDEHLEYLVKRDRVVVFLTGTPTHPRCGFAQKLIEMLAEVGLDSRGYTYVDILEDEEVCQGLKKWADWPTYPQVYVDGELVGGLDICQQMHSKKQFAPLLVPQQQQQQQDAASSASASAASSQQP